MAINIKTAGYQKKERVAAPLDVYAGTLNTLQQRHETAIDTGNKIKAILANKELNEAENKWLSDYSQQINNQIEAAAQEGSYATALTTATKLAGEVASNPGLIGRERYQQQYKKFQDEVLASKDYDDDVKAYALEQNKYNYRDTTDENGRVTGGNTFEPNYRPVAQVDIDEIYRKALSTVGVDASQGENLVWGDENGNIKNGSGNIAAGDLPYLKTSSGIKKLDANKIRMAVEAAINETPGARASLDQDYRINVWKASKGNKNLVTKKDGTIMNQEEFKENLLAPRYAASAYKQVTSTIDTSIGFSILESRRKEEARAAAKAPKTSSGSSKELRVITDFYSPFANREVQPDTPSKLTSSLNATNTNLGNLFAEYGIDKNLTTEQAYAELRKRINQNISISDDLRSTKLKEAESLYNRIQIDTNRLESVNSHLSKEERLASEFLGRRMSNGNMANTNNPYQQEYINAMNKLFIGKDGTVNDKVLLKTASKSSIERVRMNLVKLGFTSKDIRVQKVNGEEYIYISKDAYTKAAPEITELVGDGTTIGFTSSFNKTPEYFTPNKSIYYGYGLSNKNSIGHIYERISKLSENATDRLEKAFPSNFVQIQNFYIPKTVTVNGETMTKNLLDDYSDVAIKNLSTANGGALKILARDENGKLIEIDDSSERQQIINNIATGYAKSKNEVIPGWATDPATGDYGMTITLPALPKTSKINKDRPAQAYFIVGAPLNSVIEQFSNIPAVKAARTMYSIKYNSALQNGYKLSDSELGDGSYEAYYHLDKSGNSVVTIKTSEGEITGTEQEITDLITNNYANNATLAPIKSVIETSQARNGSIGNSPVEEQMAVITSIFKKVLTDSDVEGIADVPNEQRPALFQRFNSMYRNLTGENVPDSFQKEMLQLIQ